MTEREIWLHPGDTLRVKVFDVDGKCVCETRFSSYDNGKRAGWSVMGPGVTLGESSAKRRAR